MKLTKEMLKDLKPGDKIYLASGSHPIAMLQFVGLSTGDFPRAVFSSPSSTLQIPMANPEAEWQFQNGYITTTFETACSRQRELLIQNIDHFNRHSLRANPIIIVKETPAQS